MYIKYVHDERWYEISTDSFQNIIYMVVFSSLEAWKRPAHIYREFGKEGLREQPKSKHIQVLM